ncbi:MAG: helix-turn-helix domain-containing protein [Bacteroidota bacterium]
MPEEEFYTVEEVARKLGLTERTVQEKARKGEIPAYKQFGRYYFLHSEIVALIRQGERKDKK